jgi:hypothetical protein
MGELRSASVTLAEIIAYVKQTGQTGRLNVRAGDDSQAPPASLVFDEGHLVDARQGDESGDDLVYRLLGNRAATYSFDRINAETLPKERSIARWQELLVLGAIGVLTEEDTTRDDEDEDEGEGEDTAPGGPPAPRPNRATSVAGLEVPANGPPPAPKREAPPLPPPPPPVEHPRAAIPATIRTRQRPFKRRNMIALPPGDPLPIEGAGVGQLSDVLVQLERDQVSGYVTWFSDTAEGLLLLYRGQIIDAFWAEAHSPATFAEGHAVRRFAAATGAPGGGTGVNVYRLDADFVWSYSSLAYGANRSSLQGMDHVRLPALLDRLAAAEHTGCVKVVAGNQAAYLFMAGGRQLGEYRALPETLEAAPGRSMTLVAQPGSLVDIYTAPSPAELLALNAAAWPVERVIEELRRAAHEVLGTKAGQVVTLINAAGTDPQALQTACEKAKKSTRVFIGPDKYAELSGRMDRLLAHLQ